MKKLFIFYFFFKFLVLTINPSYGFIGIALNCDDTVSVKQLQFNKNVKIMILW